MRNMYIIVSLARCVNRNGMAVDVDIGDVEAFKQALEQDGFTVQQGGLGSF
jgi:hypothetical protein